MPIDDGTFGDWLKTERERRGVTLDEAAAATKINRSLLAALERNDLAQWPKGIFRRAFVREYAKAIGLSPDRAATEFARAFPDDCRSPVETLPARDEGALRLTIVAPSRPTFASLTAAILTAAVDSGVVLLTGRVLAWQLGAPFWTVTGITALLYYPAALAYLGQAPASWALGRLRSTWRAHRLAGQMRTSLDNRGQLRVVSLRPAEDATHPRGGIDAWRRLRMRTR